MENFTFDDGKAEKSFISYKIEISGKKEKKIDEEKRNELSPVPHNFIFNHDGIRRGRTRVH